jgi:glycosyltransferase involved in cell wall biosynthesis
MNMIHIITTFWNPGPWRVQRLALSLKEQVNAKFKWHVVDDGSDDGSEETLHKEGSGIDGIRRRHKERRGCHLRTQVELMADAEAKPDDLFVIIDGDDWLIDVNALSRVDECMNTRKPISMHMLAGYGGSVIAFGNRTTSTPVIPRFTLQQLFNGDVRNGKPVHLRVIRAKVMDAIPLWRFENQSTGGWFESAADLALMYPVFELARGLTAWLGGDGIRQDPIHAYDAGNPNNLGKIREQAIRRDANLALLRRFPVLDPLPQGV